MGSGLQPWEFYEYTLDEYLLRRDGLHQKRKTELRELYTHIQMLSYYTISPHLQKRYKNKPISDIIPNIYEAPKEQPNEKERYKKLIQKYKDQGLLN